MSKIYVVIGEIKYDEMESWLVIAYLNEESANDHADKAQQRASQFSYEILFEKSVKKHREKYYDENNEQITPFNKYDPKMKFIVFNDRVFIPHYYVKECELFFESLSDFNKNYVSLLIG